MVALHAMPRLVNFGLQTAEIHATLFIVLMFIATCFIIIIIIKYICKALDRSATKARFISIRKMAELLVLLHCWLQHVNSRTRLFLSRVSILTRDTDIANLSVRRSVRPSVRPPVTFPYQIKTA